MPIQSQRCDPKFCNLHPVIVIRRDSLCAHRYCLAGIERVEVEASIEKVVITGYANRNKIVKALRRVGLRAEFWSAHNEILSTYATGSVMFNTYSFF
ncbi:hypothetical protein BHE74_00053098 [Ensete ventricosum]|uniref:Uncharacterized protein n=1 Tax=Ensete ventricosum TaxID=4639 RepID=A0A444EJD8_ENSVE|nr:hypothetical protein B296_00059200 [Ensete ventricosum]RWW10529.1 hypothetical protein GW17_00025921 [Ensete ventricosum]RWW41422.1 hypothetical protein BHE74_00053098 [Ensete ventricosum]RZS26141.1 hypothetical protein BHM03_00059446 [Ensete ventricosum]